MRLLIALRAPLFIECCPAARNGGLALAQMLLYSAEPAEGLVGAQAFGFHGASPCQIWLFGELP